MQRRTLVNHVVVKAATSTSVLANTVALQWQPGNDEVSGGWHSLRSLALGGFAYLRHNTITIVLDCQAAVLFSSGLPPCSIRLLRSPTVSGCL